MTELWCDGIVVAEYVEQPDLALVLAPRPYLHPVRTLAGITVTDAIPQDHPWHFGVSVGIPSVQVPYPDGGMLNFWGGRTYVRDQGYTWLDDHGMVETVRELGPDLPRPSALQRELDWRVPGHPAVLRERRRIVAVPLTLPSRTAVRPRAWALRQRFELANLTSGPVALGSPATNGRTGAGYGGFFWRVASSGKYEVTVQTPEGDDESSVHGQAADWLIFGGAEPDTGQAWSLLFAGQDEITRADPWFVRVEDYPGVGSALAFELPVVLAPGERLIRSVLVAVLDGDLDPTGVPAVLSAARSR
jgi:hypothetical protein